MYIDYKLYSEDGEMKGEFRIECRKTSFYMESWTKDEKGQKGVVIVGNNGR